MEMFGLVAVGSLMTGIALAALGAVLLIGVLVGASLALRKLALWRRSSHLNSGELGYLTMPGEGIAADVVRAAA